MRGKLAERIGTTCHASGKTLSWSMLIKTMLMVTVIGVLPAVYAQSPKRPWSLSLEERIALRTNRALAGERARGEGRVRANVREGAPPLADSFDGRTHPELFLPHQVFRSLMDMAFLGGAKRGEWIREAMRAEVQEHGLPPDFWERLRVVSAIHISDATAVNDIAASLRQLHGRARRQAEYELALKQADTCRTAADALAAARREFGAEHFDRFLYDAIAIHMFHAADQLPEAEDLRKIERGCR